MPVPHPGSGESALPALRALLFDAGGTLLHMPRTPEEILSDLCREMGVSVTPEQAWSACRASERYYVEHYLAYTGDQGEFWHRYHGAALADLGIEDPDGEKAAHLSHGFGLPGIWQPFPEAAVVCRRLRALGLRLGVVSNGPVTVVDLLAQAGLLPHFEVVIASQDAGIEKPDPRVFEMALERLRTPARQALFVGDVYDVDVLGARAAGMAAVLIDRHSEGIRRDCPVIRTLEELIPMVSGAEMP